MCIKYPHTLKGVIHKCYTQNCVVASKAQQQTNFSNKDTAILEIFAVFWTLFLGRSFFVMYYNIKEKSWSVLLIKGYVMNNQVRAERCENCRSTTEVLTANQGNPNLLLYGCKDSKCKHRMLRLDFDAGVSTKFSFGNITSPISCKDESASAIMPVLP